MVLLLRTSKNNRSYNKKKNLFRKRFFFLLIFILAAEVFIFKDISYCSSKDSNTEKNLYQLYQYENTEAAIIKFFEDFKINFKSDTSIVFILPPMGCPRCEGAINPINEYLKKFKVESDIIIVAVHNKKKAAEKYLKKKSFNADYNIVVDDSFLENFYLSVEPLKVPFITKFNHKIGKLLYSKSLLGYNLDSLNIINLINPSVPLLIKKIKSSELNKSDQTKANGIYLKNISDIPIRKKLKLIDTDEYSLSNVLDFQINRSFSFLSTLDELSLNLYIYDLETGRLETVLYPDLNEEKKFIDVPEPIYDYIKQNNIIQSMYFSHKFYNDTQLLISASLPKVYEIEEDNIGYSNEAVFILKNVYNNNDNHIINFSNHPDILFGLNHPKAQFILQDSLIFIPLSKGWPTRGTTVITSNINDSENPFSDLFYVYTPQFAVYDFSGNFLKYYGQLDDSHKKLKLGYYANNPIIKAEHSNYLIADKYAGKIQIYQKFNDSSIPKEISIFKIDFVNTNLDYTKQPLKYITETFKKIFQKNIIDFVSEDSVIHTLIDEGNSLSLISIHQFTNNRNINYFPKYFDSMKFKKALLKIIRKEVIICSLYENSDDTFYFEFASR